MPLVQWTKTLVHAVADLKVIMQMLLQILFKQIVLNYYSIENSAIYFIQKISQLGVKIELIQISYSCLLLMR